MLHIRSVIAGVDVKHTDWQKKEIERLLQQHAAKYEGCTDKGDLFSAKNLRQLKADLEDADVDVDVIEV